MTIENFLRTKGERGATFEEITSELERKFEDHNASDKFNFKKNIPKG